MMAKFRSLFATLRAMLAEIFDEAAYQRFLRTEGVASSADAYRHFLQHRHAPGVARRCC